MKANQKLAVAIASGLSISLVCGGPILPAQAITLTQTYSVDLGPQGLNTSTKILLPKFNSLLGTLLRAYVTVSSQLNSHVSITPLSGEFTGTAATNAQIAINLPRYKADPFLALNLFAEPAETSIANGQTGTVSGTGTATASQTFDRTEILNTLTGCDGDYVALGIGTTGSTLVTGTLGRGRWSGNVWTDQKISVTYEYESVPEPLAIAGWGLAAGLGFWWKKKEKSQKVQ